MNECRFLKDCTVHSVHRNGKQASHLERCSLKLGMIILRILIRFERMNMETAENASIIANFRLSAEIFASLDTYCNNSPSFG